ncbi:hypothetical protein YB2330_000149 [Saitoella coloradoensis]
MKFGKSFERQLEEEDIPVEWRSAAIQYKALKKCINKVVLELSSLGLSASTIRLLLCQDGEKCEDNGLNARLTYSFDGNIKSFTPKIVLTIDGDIPVTADLSPNTRHSFEELLLNQQALNGISVVSSFDPLTASAEQIADAEMVDDIVSERDVEAIITEITDEEAAAMENGPASPASEESEMDFDHVPDSDEGIFIADEDSPSKPRPADIMEDEVGESSHPHAEPRKIEITLTSDSEFFHMLTSELENLEALQAKQKETLSLQVTALSNCLTKVTNPETKRGTQKSDLYPWREVFRLYLDAGVFFADTERERGERTVEKAKERLEWFAKQLADAEIVGQFKQGLSKPMLDDFWRINMAILRNLRFQKMNHMAMYKILKKFDKRTSLSARITFPELIAADSTFTQSMAQAICYTMSTNLLSIIPQLDDYICPICASITMKPVRLPCSHVFCVRCLVKLQREKKKQCPICRRDVVMLADSSNIDSSLLNFLKLYFPIEAKLKQIENEKEVAMEQMERMGMAPGQQGKCVVM